MIVSSLHMNICMHILPSVLYTFPKVLIRRICLTTKKMRSKTLAKITPAVQATSKCEWARFLKFLKCFEKIFHFFHLDTGEFNKTCRQQFRKTEKRIGKTRRVDADALLHVALDNDNNSLCCLYVDDNVYQTFSEEILMRIIIEL